MLKATIRILKSNGVFMPVLFAIDLALFCIDLLACTGKRNIHTNKVCIIKLDKVGDYFLIRNFLQYFVALENKKGNSITYIGNIENKHFAELLDNKLFDHNIWIDIYKYTSNPIYRYKISRCLYREGFSIAISPTYSRVLVLDDFIAFATRAKIKIAQKAHPINIKKWENLWGDFLYTDIIPVCNEVIFEFERNKMFFEKITGEELQHIPMIAEFSVGITQSIESFIIIMPGAADSFRQWSPKYFAEIADYLIQNFEYSIILCGSASEYQIGELIIRNSKYGWRIINNIGKLSLKELFTLIISSKFIISNETGAVHFCAALNASVYVISNGNHFLKYTEYPKRLGKRIFYVYPNELNDLKDNMNHYSQIYDLKSTIDINSISPIKLLESIQINS